MAISPPQPPRPDSISCTTMSRQPAVYILASRRNGTLYVGVTSNLPQRVWEHKQGLVEGFTKHYGVHQLVWYALFETMTDAIAQEKRMKRWQRGQKLMLIEAMNPQWRDLFEDFVAGD
jgi:putative endonuclease